MGTHFNQIYGDSSFSDILKSHWYGSDLSRSNLFFLHMPILPNIFVDESEKYPEDRSALAKNFGSWQDDKLITNRQNIPKASNSILKKLPLFVKSISVPGSALTTNEINIDGNMRKFAYDTAYATELTVEFYINPNFDIYKIFDYWMKAINPEIGVIEYYDNYIVPMEILNLDRKLELASSFHLTEAYPVSVEPVQYQSGMGEANTFQVNFQYYSLTTDTIDINEPDKYWASKGFTDTMDDYDMSEYGY